VALLTPMLLLDMSEQNSFIVSIDADTNLDGFLFKCRLPFRIQHSNSLLAKFSCIGFMDE